MLRTSQTRTRQTVTTTTTIIIIIIVVNDNSNNNNSFYCPHSTTKCKPITYFHFHRY